jgi:hypothetical protein
LPEVEDAPRVVRGRTGEVQVPVTVPSSLLIVPEVLRPCFTAPSFTTMAALVTGALSGNAPRTLTGMWQAAGLAGKAHWSRAHRFFSRAVRDLDQVGLALARSVVARFVPRGAAVTLAVDATLFHRYGKKVHGAKYQHDGSAKGRDGIGRGNCFVITGIVVTAPFLARQVCLPVLFRLHIPKTSISRTEQARTMVDLFAQALPDRVIHIVGDALYRGPAWRAALSARFPGDRLVVPAGGLRTRANDTEYPFRAAAEYVHLTGGCGSRPSTSTASRSWCPGSRERIPGAPTRKDRYEVDINQLGVADSTYQAGRLS